MTTIDDLDIAVIGLAGRFPGASNIEEFWRNLREGRESIRELRDEELRAAGVPTALLEDPAYVRAASILENVDLFDAEFFGYSPREASLLDPQARLFLECTWEALECAGYNPLRTGAPVGVYAAQSTSTYLLGHIHAQLALEQFALAGGNIQAIIGTASDFLPTRVSYKLNLSGPSVNVQTACSSALVAVHLARQALLSGECEMALAGAVSIYLPQTAGYVFQEGMILSPDGRCRPFDASAAGTIFGRGVGVVVLKGLREAIRDGDDVYAVIKGSAINNDGAGKVGYTAPSVEGQSKVIAEALANAGVDADSISYVEAHGTGTPQGDPIEIEALKRAFRASSTRKQYCAIGSVKGNIGHLDVAAGMAGLIKTILMLRHRERVASLHFTRPNPAIDFSNSPFHVNARLGPWPTAGGVRRRAGVSSFGMGGTNAHVVLEEAPETEVTARQPERPVHLLTLSAKSEAALRELASATADWLNRQPKHVLSAVCFTSNRGREHFSHRLAVAARTNEQAATALASIFAGDSNSRASLNKVPAAAPRVIFMFTGQGSQYHGMGRGLYDSEPVYRQAIDECAALLEPELDVPLCSLLFDERHAGLIDQTRYAQPALFAVEIALARLWQSWGVEPDVLMGHSLGENVAACVGGAFSLQDGAFLVARRAKLMQSLPQDGEMIAVRASRDFVSRWVSEYRGKVAIAAFNGPSNVVLSGERSVVRTVAAELAAQGIECRTLKTSHAFHSPLMEPILDEFEEVARRIRLAPPKIPLISNITGRRVSEELRDPCYWRRHISEPVCFAASVDALELQPSDVVIEIGPRPTLIAMAQECGAFGGVHWLPSLRRGRDDVEQILESLGAAFTAGLDPDWEHFHEDRPVRRVAFPSYPFQRQRYWIDRPTATGAHDEPASEKPVGMHFALRSLSSPALSCDVFETQMGLRSQPYVADHAVAGVVVFPATGFLELAFEVAQRAGAGHVELANFTIDRPLLCIGPDVVAQAVLEPPAERGARRRLRIFARADEAATGLDWTLHAAGDIVAAMPIGQAFDSRAAVSRCTISATGPQLYEQLRRRGFEYGQAFQGIANAWWSEDEAVARITVPDALANGSKERHPALFDAALQTVLTLVGRRDGEGHHAYVPASFERVFVSGSFDEAAWARATLRDPDRAPVADVEMTSADGRLIAAAYGIRIAQVSRAEFGRPSPATRAPVYEIDWEPSSLPPLRPPGAVADFIPSPTQLAARAEASVEAIRARHGIDVYDELLPKLDALCADYIAQAFIELGWGISVDQTFTVDALAEELRILPGQRSMLERCLEILEEEGLLEVSANGWRVLKVLERSDDLDRRIASLMADYPSCRAELTLIRRCASSLAAVLSGDADPLQLLFADGNAADLAKLYCDAPFTRAYNEIVTEAVAGALESVPFGRKLRILEIGAGTGGTSASVLPILPADSVEYVFTDASKLFMVEARKRFAEFPFVRYELLDIERDPASQGFRSRDFDIILATNVLHATPDLRRTLKYVNSLLAPGGLLVVVEGVSRQRWVDMIFGLTEGWWKVADYDVRGNYPLISQSAWRNELRRAGFEDSCTVPADDQRPICEQAVMLARGGESATSEIAADDVRSAAVQYLAVGESDELAGVVAERLAALGTVAIMSPVDTARADPENGSGARHEKSSRMNGRKAHEEVVDADFSDAGRVAAGLDAALGGSDACRAVVYCMAANPAVPKSLPELRARLARDCRSLLHLAQALATRVGAPRLCVVTRGAEVADDADDNVDAVAAAVSGLLRVVALEHPELRCVHVDFDSAASDETVAAGVVAELAAAGPEDRICWRGSTRRVARLRRVPRAAALQEGEPDESSSKLDVVERGVLDRFVRSPCERRTPGEGEVEIKVAAAGLNFKDVLNALGTYPGDAGELGLECAGTVTAVGAAVDSVFIGDDVVAIAPGCFATHVVTRADLVTRRPIGLAVSEAAGIPAAFLTAYHALHELAGVTSADKVLIHAAAGGVGMAAVQLALRAGAEVFGSAGSPEKRDLLRQLGVAHVLDSRSTSFAEEVLRLTQGAGVNVVLNSLAGEFIDRNFDVLAKGGRYIELGKAGIWQPAQVEALGRDIRYHIVDVQERASAQPVAVGDALRAVVQLVAEGELQPLPVQVYPIAEAGEAFRFMAQAKHVGKIVLRVDAAADELVRPDASYLITGGFGGLGLLLARWLAERGARHIALMGRRAPEAVARDVIAELEAQGVRIIEIVGDVGSPNDVSRALDLTSRFAPLRGIVHAAGTLDDAALTQQRWDRFERVLHAKALGAWNLHRQTAGMALDWFVLFSSLAAILGSRGQSNHAAANSFMDALAESRRRQGLHALSIDWGAWSEVGAAAQRDVLDRLRSIGIGAISPQEGIRLFEGVLKRSMAEGGAHVAVLPVDWSAYVHSVYADRAPPLLAHIVGRVNEPATVESADVVSEAETFVERLATALPGARRELLTSYLREQVIRCLGLDPQRSLDNRQPLSELGLDSLMAVELRSRIARGLGTSRPLPATLLFDYPTIDALVEYLRRELLPDSEAQTNKKQTSRESAQAAARAEIEALTEEEAEAQLLAELSAKS